MRIALSAQTNPTALMGYLIPDGTYRRSTLCKAYEQGATVLLEDFTAAQPKVILKIAEIENSDCHTFPDGTVVKRHPNFKMEIESVPLGA